MWRGFGAYAHILLCPSVGLRKKFALLDNLAKVSLMWCAGSWNLTRKDEDLIRACQTKMYRTCALVRKRQHESVEQFMIRSNSFTKSCRVRFQSPDWLHLLR